MALDSEHGCTLQLRGELTIRTAADTHHQLLDALHEAGTVTLDMTQADEFDLTFIQLLCAAKASAAASGVHLRFSDPLPEKLQTMLARGGFQTAPLQSPAE